MQFSQPVSAEDASNLKNYKVISWYYEPTIDYGGPKLGITELPVKSVKVKDDKNTVDLEVDGLQENHVVYLWTQIKSAKGEAAWDKEAWCTVNKIIDKNTKFAAYSN